MDNQKKHLDDLSFVYEVGAENISDDDILRLRNLLDSNDEEIVEMAVMRLCIRGKDVSSKEKIEAILFGSDNRLVKSACILGLSSLAENFLPERSSIMDIISAVSNDANFRDVSEVAANELKALRKLF